MAGKGRIELLLAMGASRMEATRESVQRCLILALTPVLNQMSVMGIVSIPGMMTGQILGGTDPSQVHLCCCKATTSGLTKRKWSVGERGASQWAPSSQSVNVIPSSIAV